MCVTPGHLYIPPRPQKRVIQKLENGEKRPRGRPKKKREIVDEHVKKPRGRPKKIRQVAVVSDLQDDGEVLEGQKFDKPDVSHEEIEEDNT